MNKVSFLRNKTWLGIVFVIILMIGIGFLMQYKSHKVTEFQSSDSNELLPLSATIISPQGVHIDVRVADTNKTMELGLSYFKSLPKKQGMLFVFPQVGIYSFWMKDMNFPIDIIWMDENFTVVDRFINVDPSSYPKTYTPSTPAAYVLEIPANTADEYGFNKGTTAQMDYNE